MTAATHDHVFLGQSHDRNERRTWLVVGLCSAMMVVEIAGGLAFGSLALVADGLHMSPHAGALLLAALAYRFARKYASDPRFTFGAGKLGDLAGFTSAIVLAMIAMLIGYEAVARFLAPVPIHFREAIPIAALGLAVNIASALLLSGDDITITGTSTAMAMVTTTTTTATGTTTCGPPSCTSWPTRRSRFW
jgi:cation diffusion facilitator family transporter